MTAEDYLGRVHFAVRDLPWSTRRDLVSELRDHLGELPAGTDLEARLGAPEAYAADLRSAAGLERRRGPIAFLRARRPRNLVLTMAVLTAIGLAIGAVTWVDAYQPLALGMGFRYPTGARQDPAGQGQYVVFRQGRPFHLGVTIRNTGSYTVRVLGAPLGPGTRNVSVRLLMSGVMPNGGFPLTLGPFRPFDLKPGQERALVLQGVYRAPAYCRSWTAGSIAGLYDFPVRFSFLWRTSTVQLPLPDKLTFVFRKGSCG